MKKYIFLLIIVLLLIPIKVFAGRGCCSSHGGVCGCTKYGKQACCDGTASPSCTCTPPQVYGCTDYRANNYNREANVNDGSCTYTVPGCTDPNANNYNSNANQDNGSCTYDVYGCTDSTAKNYNSSANKDDGSCEYEIKEVSNLYDNKENENNEGSSGGIGVALLTLLSSAGAIVYAKKKKK